MDESKPNQPVDKIYTTEKSKNSSIPLFIFIAAIIVGLGIFIFFKFKTNSDEFTLYKESGEVLYRDGQSQYAEMVKDEIKLKSGTYVKTKNGIAHVVFVDNSVMSLDTDTEVQVNTTNTGVSINQIVGNTWHRIQKITGNNSYTVETPTAIASVRGTKFAIGMIPKLLGLQSNILVKEGDVKLDLTEVEKGKKVVKLTADVKDGKYLRIPVFKANTKLVVQDIPNEIKDTSFYKRNDNLDKQFDSRMKGGNFINKWVFKQMLRESNPLKKLNDSGILDKTDKNRTTDGNNTDKESSNALQTNDQGGIFGSGFSAKYLIDMYIKSKKLDPQFCEQFAQQSSNEVISKINELLKQYNVPAMGADQYKSILDTISKACTSPSGSQNNEQPQ